MKQAKNSVLIFIVSVLISNVYAQELQISSLLSNFGSGTRFSEATVSEKAQGDLSVVNNNTKENISIVNPASLSNLTLTSFSASINLLGNKIESETSNYNTSVVSLSNVSFAIPLGPKGGFAIGLRARSAVGFEVDSDTFYNSANGGVNQIYIGLGYKIFKGLSVGAQLSNYFGKTEKISASKNIATATVLENRYNVTGNSFKFGVEYEYPLSKKIKAQIGVIGALSYDLKADGTFELYDAIETDENVFTETTTDSQVENTNGREENPFKYTVGFGLGEEDHWFAGLSYESQDAVSYTGNAFNRTNESAGASYERANKISLGGYITPDKYALKNYFKKVTYRAGVKYENTGLELNDNSVKNIGVSFGFGLPVGRKVSYLNLSFELGRVGDVGDNNYQEEYFNVGVNFSLADKWFKKRVID